MPPLTDLSAAARRTAPPRTAVDDNRTTRRKAAAILFALLLILYNSNGRELGTGDSQPTKFAARELAARGTLRLDRVIGERPGLAARPAFALDQTGHWRSAYPVLPAVLAAIPAFVLDALGLVDVDAPLEPNLIAALTASLLTAAAVTLVFLALCRIAPIHVALLTAIGLGAGTNYWGLVSRTLWQHETVAFGIALALWVWLQRNPRRVHWWWGGFGLALAVAARPQVLPIAIVMLCWLGVRCGWRSVAAASVAIAALVATVAAGNLHWFGSVFGATPQLEAVHTGIHSVRGSISRDPWVGALGLLVSPSRGILVFSPIVLIALLGLRNNRAVDPSLRLGWLPFASLAQFLAYSCYTVWWGGHTYGPRYLLDALVPLTPCGALGTAALARIPAGRIAGTLLFAWSVLVASAGAFIYPNELWNIDPLDVDRQHGRLWEIKDSQIPRAFRSPVNPHNYDLFSRAAVRS